MKQTAMQEYIEYLEGIQKRDNLPRWIITTAKNYREAEKQQIINFADEISELPKKDIEKLYNETFKKR